MRAVSQAIADVAVSTPRGGTVNITVLTNEGLPDNRLLNDIRSYISGEVRRPLCDTVIVQAPKERKYQIQARLTLLEDFREDVVKTNALNALQNFLASKTKRLGMDIVPSAIISVLRVEGVYDVQLISPTKTIINENEWANCTAIRIDVEEQRTHG